MKIRTDSINDNKLVRSEKKLFGIANEYPEGATTDWHTHERDQFLAVFGGVVTVSTESGIWVVPPERAVYIPHATLHKIEITDNAFVKSLFIDTSIKFDAPLSSTVIQISPLVKELILSIFNLPQAFEEEGANGRLVSVVFDQIALLPTEPLYLPTTEEPRVKRILDALYKDPSIQFELARWAKELNVSPRTLTRLFEKELSMSFVRCRHQIRMHAALRGLAAGKPVGVVALDVGYQSQSNFTMLFKRFFGCTPTQYFESSTLATVTSK